MPGATTTTDNYHNNDDNSYNQHNNNNFNIMDGGNGVYTIHAMGGAGSNPDRYLSNESLETNSSGESSSNLGNIPHRKDHEFIPTRMKQIAASKPAADPKQFTRVPSNPLLVSAQKQLMMVEEVKKAKELVLQPKVKGGDDEPDWQNNLSTWKNRRRKQSEEALQRVSEVKSMDDDEFGTAKKSSIGRKLSALLYTAPEDDWSDLGLEKGSNSKSDDSPPIQRKQHNNNSRTHSRSSLISPTNQDSIREEDNEIDEEENLLINSTLPPEKHTETPTNVDPPAVSKTEKVDTFVKAVNKNSTPERSVSTVETPPSVAVSVLNRKFSEVGLNLASKPIVTFTNQDSTNVGPPPVRRKSSELSTTMRSRLEAFISPSHTVVSNSSGATDSREKSAGDHTPEPDEKFHEKLSTFRKISEGAKEEDVSVQRKPKLSYSSLIAADFNQSNQRRLQEPAEEEEENEDSVDQLLDDALEESYRSVLEDSEIRGDSFNSEDGKNVIFKGDDFLPAPSVLKAPPSEKPPPPPPETPKEDVRPPLWPQKPVTVLDDDEIDKQEQEIIASLENEEREHLKYMENVQAMRTSEDRVLPKILNAPFSGGDNISPKKISPTVDKSKKVLTTNDNLSKKPAQNIGSQRLSTTTMSEHKISSSSTSNLVTSTTTILAPNKITSSVSQPHLVNEQNKASMTSSGPAVTSSLSKKRPSDVGNQKIYNNQHWLIQEAEQRRLAELQQQPQQKQQQQQQQPKGLVKQISPAPSSPALSLISQASPSPVYENLNNKQTVKASSYNNHQRPEASVSPAHSDASWQSSQQGQVQPPPLPRSNNAYPQENLYANLGSVLAPQPNFETSPLHFQRDSNSQGRLPGPQVPPRVQPSERLPAQNGTKAGPAGGERMLSVSGKKKCSHCKEELGRGAAMIIESLRLFYHLRCFQCCVCHVQLGNGTAGTDVRVRNNKLHCQNCYSNDEGLKFSKV